MAANPWFEGGVQQTLEQYIPLPLETLAKAGQAVQGRYDANMAAFDQAATGVASIDSRLPAHREYVAQYADRFRQESDALLDKYNGRADDPQFARELKQLTNRYANDPNLRTILQANKAYDANMATRQKLEQEGQRFIDTTGRTSGIDEQGRLTADVGQIRATNFDKDLRTMFRDTLQATINNNKGTISNEQAVSNTVNTLMAGGANNPVIREALEYYTSQGMSPEQAGQQVQLDIQREAGSALTVDRDSGYYSNQLGWANFNQRQKEFNYEVQKDAAKQNRMGAMIAFNSPVEVQNLNKDLIKETEKAISQINSGSKSFTMVPDTPENRAKYPDAKVVTQRAAGSAGVGAPGMSPMLRLDDVQTERNRQEFVESARSEISNILAAKGINPNTATPKQVLENYKEYLQADNNAPTFWSSPVKEVRDNLTRQYIGQSGENLGDAIIVNKKGKGERVANGDIDLTTLSGFDFTGVTTSPVRGNGYNIPNGAIKGTAVDKNGNIVTVYKPLPPVLQQSTNISNTVDRAILSGLSNPQLLKDPSYRILNGNIAPQKVGGTVKFYEVDSNGKIIGDEFNSAQIEEILNSEKAAISEYFSLHQNTD